ncbi:hypothetical protein PC129_g21555 [Phytophthora cactorum]|uniref:Uncharacterized protein n=2 Tax=Phytophthora cactorum TaxID=29920 RepID=A0A8T1EUF4_9STRA|nr:hypothetical protein Pcac1_g23306 [Phytophthora cactorum]KAG2796510.1 hypothetical protein PC112_g22175 [Phytophthora cactorum]KAG2824243.1 hypothetical protein PC113_g22062 [Phytophthora cactorum]KAG2831970.1 hypothetical protein PC111_g6778 [Phytophthora cactorum]KAG2882485.1 hypothetical protein PC115_g21931 [Phytophthora cactorum]
MKLRKAWKLLHRHERETYINENPESEYPEGIMDGRKDRSRYPKMIPADIDTPEVISDRLPQAQTQALSTLNKTTKDQVDQVQKYRQSTLEALIVSEVSALAFAVKSGDILKFLHHAKGVAEGLGATIANKVDSSERGTVVNATEDVVRLINAARTQFALHDAKEEESEVADSQNSARVAFRALANSTGKYARTNPGCLSLYEEITQLKAVTSYCLKNVYWFPEEGASSLPTKKRRMS